MNSSTKQQASAPSRKRTKRRQYLINPAFQWKYAVTIAFGVFVTSTIMSSVLYGILHHQARMRTLDPVAYSADVTFVVFLAGAAFALLTGAGVGLWSIIVTHRMVGPLYVMSRFMLELKEGRLPKMRALRQKDEFKEFYEVFVGAVDNLRVMKQRQLGVLTEAMTTIHSMERAEGDERSRAVQSLSGQLREMREELARALGEDPDTGSTEPPSGVEAPEESVCSV